MCVGCRGCSVAYTLLRTLLADDGDDVQPEASMSDASFSPL